MSAYWALQFLRQLESPATGRRTESADTSDLPFSELLLNGTTYDVSVDDILAELNR